MILIKKPSTKMLCSQKAEEAQTQTKKKKRKSPSLSFVDISQPGVNHVGVAISCLDKHSVSDCIGYKQRVFPPKKSPNTVGNGGGKTDGGGEGKGRQAQKNGRGEAQKKGESRRKLRKRNTAQVGIR